MSIVKIKGNGVNIAGDQGQIKKGKDVIHFLKAFLSNKNEKVQLLMCNLKSGIIIDYCREKSLYNLI